MCTDDSVKMAALDFIKIFQKV